jgi:hypothetical protein
MWLLVRDLLDSPVAALFGAAFYGFCGFFAAHSSHVGMFQAAALTPWLLWSARRALREQDRLRWISAAGLAGSCIVLAGHFQTALYAFVALVLFLAVERTPRAAVVAVTAIGATLAGSAVIWLPGMELTRQSIRASADYSQETNSSLEPGTLMTLIFPDQYGAQSGKYHGPPDITQFYFYSGILLVPFAIAGCFAARVRWYAAALILPSIWYALGPPGGLYRLIAMFPGFRSVRAPVHIWFVVALGLALLAAGGVEAMRRRFPQPVVMGLMLLVVCLDLWYSNMDQNALAYGRFAFDARYGVLYEQFRAVTSPLKQPLARFWSPGPIGQFNASLVVPTEVTFGYNPLELSRYAAYVEAAGRNPKLVNSLAATAKFEGGRAVPNPDAMPRAIFPERVRAGSTGIDSIDPAVEALVEGLPGGMTPDPGAVAQITAYEGDRYRVHYRSSAQAVLRMAIPYFPGWHARAEGRELQVLPADVALTAIVVPAGEHDIDVTYRSTWFATGASVSALAWVAGTALLFNRRRRAA